MQINSNLFNTALELAEDCELTGNVRCAKVTTSGHKLTVSSLAHHGITIDGSKNPADWGANVVFTVPIFEGNATYTIPIMAIDDDALALRTRTGENTGGDGLAALEWLAARVITFEETREEVKAAWVGEATSMGNKIHFDTAIDAFIAVYSLGDWLGLQDFLRSKPLEAWRGEAIPTGEVIS